MSVSYDSDFFANQNGAIRSARKLLPLIFDIVRPHTLVDVGCGIGAWAKVAKELGCAVTGLDGDWVPREQLLIEPQEFMSVDLANPPQDMSARFDLAMSLEVAEHLPAATAERFVRFITRLAPVVVFSAAVPWQMGTRHINEQYPGYWVRWFERCDFVPFDVIRPRCWYDQDVEFYYRQNLLIYVSRARVTEFEAVAKTSTIVHPLDIVHPDAVPILAQGWVEAGGTRRCVDLLRKTVARSLRKRLGLA
jgi:SAM-dependent methyltransferase